MERKTVCGRFRLTPDLWRLVIVAALVLQASGCAGAQPQSQPDPYVVAVDILTANMPDVIAPDLAELFKAGLGRLSRSNLLRACLSEAERADLSNIMSNAQGLNWPDVRSTDRLRELLLSDKMVAVDGLFESAAATCNSQQDGEGGESNPFASDLFLEALFVNSDYITFSDERGKLEIELNTYLACMTDAHRFIHNNSCGSVVADESTSVDVAPESEIDMEPMEFIARDQTTLWLETVDWREVDKAAFVFVITLIVGIVVTAATSNPVAGGAAAAKVSPYIGVAAAAGSAALADILFELLNPDPENFPEPEEMCPGPYDSFLTSGHPLQGASYQIDGVPFGADALYDACTCLGVDANDPDPRTWGCKDEAEKRRDCLRNPYGPDDAPRPECIQFLFEDNGIEPPDQCSAAECPAPYTLVNQEQCTCGPPAPPAGGLIPNPDAATACSQMQCGPESIPAVVNGACICAPLGGAGSGQPGGPPPESP